jgi:hypothetical protein
MPPRAEYRVISGAPLKIEQDIAPLAAKGFRPILITSSPTNIGIVIVIVMEHVLQG